MIKVIQFYNKNQFVVKTNNCVYFQSYDSLIACYNYELQRLFLSSHWDYSKTTLKHLYLFINEYSNFYMPDSKKKAFIKNLIKAGEIKVNLEY